MINEVSIERSSIIKFFTDENNGLGYQEVSKSVVSKDLFIKQDLLDFLKTDLNKDNFKLVLKKHFNNDEDELYKELQKELKKELNALYTYNVTFLLNKEFKFKGRIFHLFHKKNLLQKENRNSKQNKFSIVSQYSHNLYYQEKEIAGSTFRPDLLFFINGIYIGYLELKFITNNQNAQNEGVSQIISKFRDSYKKFKDSHPDFPEHYSQSQKKAYIEKTLKEYKEFMRIFTSSIFTTAFDIHSLYIIRNFDKIKELMDDKNFDHTYGIEELTEQSKPEFKEYPNPTHDWELLLSNIYSKDNLENEILYYNFEEKNQELKNGDFKNKIGRTGSLISPRPKQKYGTDKVIELAKEYLKFEQDEDYWDSKQKEMMKQLPLTVQNNILEERRRYKNNKYVNSVLLSYAAGFGKTNVIGWLALMLKDLTIEGDVKNHYAYDKIFLIADRLELKDQLIKKMQQMNGDKYIVKEVNNRNDFMDALNNPYKMVIVNIQKFSNIKEALTKESVKKLKGQRIAFLIDEIHRSNSGSQHEDMMSMFTELFMDQDDNGSQKKNLVVGLTATPTDEVMLRFGEYSGCDGEKPIFKSHDEYTMADSIKDGYTLDFSHSITPYAIKMEMFIPEGMDIEEAKQNFKKKSVYENEERIKAVSKVVAQNLVNNVYSQIGGYGKAMLACSSIQVAIKHHRYVKEYLEILTSQKPYEKYKEAGVYIVYSKSENYVTPDPKDLNIGDNGVRMNERQTIDRFKNKKNGIIIVVDKLQTGFDEKRLHTLFLNKEITGINAIQTASRVNRTAKNKSDCHIIDFSHDNINFKENMPNAIKKHMGTHYSGLSTKSPEELLIKSYGDMTKHRVYKEFYDEFNNLKNNDELTDEYLKFESKIVQFHKKNTLSCESLMETTLDYIRSYKIIRNIIDIEDYTSYDFRVFFYKISNIFRQLLPPTSLPKSAEIKAVFEDIGVILPEKEDDVDIPPHKPGKPTTPNGDSASGSQLIDKLIKKEEMKGESIESYKNNLNKLFSALVVMGRKEQSEDIESKIKDGSFSEEELLSIFEKLVRKVKRRNKDFSKEFLQSVIDYKPNAYFDFVGFVNNGK